MTLVSGPDPAPRDDHVFRHDFLAPDPAGPDPLLAQCSPYRNTLAAHAFRDLWAGTEQDSAEIFARGLRVSSLAISKLRRIEGTHETTKAAVLFIQQKGSRAGPEVALFPDNSALTLQRIAGTLVRVHPEIFLVDTKRRTLRDTCGRAWTLALEMRTTSLKETSLGMRPPDGRERDIMNLFPHADRRNTGAGGPVDDLCDALRARFLAEADARMAALEAAPGLLAARIGEGLTGRIDDRMRAARGWQDAAGGAFAHPPALPWSAIDTATQDALHARLTDATRYLIARDGADAPLAFQVRFQAPMRRDGRHRQDMTAGLDHLPSRHPVPRRRIEAFIRNVVAAPDTPCAWSDLAGTRLWTPDGGLGRVILEIRADPATPMSAHAFQHAHRRFAACLPEAQEAAG